MIGSDETLRIRLRELEREMRTEADARHLSAQRSHYGETINWHGGIAEGLERAADMLRDVLGEEGTR